MSWGWFIRTLRQTATYWAPTTKSAYGFQAFAAPVQLSCRWEDEQEQFTDRAGNNVVSDALVHLETDVEEGGYLYLGTSTETDPTTVGGAYQIKRCMKSPDIKGVNYVRIAYL